jgi:hypothetical protein
VYAKTVKIYKGVNNVIQFDIQNADQKRLDLVDDPLVTNLQMNVMDTNGYAVGIYPVTPYHSSVVTATGATVYPTLDTNTSLPIKRTTTTIDIPTTNITGSFSVNCVIAGTSIKEKVTVTNITKDLDTGITTLTVNFGLQTVFQEGPISITSVSDPIKGIGIVTIPATALANIQHQFLKYSLTATDGSGNHIPLYTDSRFSAVGKIDVVESAIPIDKPTTIYDRFSGEINYMGNVINHSSAFQCKFYEAVKTESVSFTIDYTGFLGTIYAEGTKDSTISVESFRDAEHLYPITTSVRTTGSTTITVPINDFNYIRISWLYPDIWALGSQMNTNPYGTVDKITVNY